jgi:regulator of protease activity HflC (stomatin/prohibitin superfamily)
VPWFVRYQDVDANDEPNETGREDVTLKDGRLVSFKIVAVVRVRDAEAAVVKLGHYQTETKPLLASRVAQELAEMDPERVLPARRTRLNTSVKEWATQELAPYGIEVVAARFSTFVLNPRAIRLLGDADKPE